MKKMSVFAALAAGLLMLGSSMCSFADDAAPVAVPVVAKTSSSPDDAIAIVNGKQITHGLMDKIMEQAVAGQKTQEDTPEVRGQVLDKLVELELISQKAIADGLDKSSDFLMEMEMAKNQQLYIALLKKDVFDVVKVDEAEIKDYYDKHKDEFQTGEEVTASHILVDTEDEAKAIKGRLDKGEEFEALAKEVSKCPSASRGGDLGSFGKGRMVPEFEKAAFSLKEGEVTSPVKTQFGWHIIKLTGRKDAGAKPLADVSGSIQQTMLQEKQKKAYEDLLAGLKADAKIEIKDAEYAAPAPAAAGAGDTATPNEAVPAESE